MKAVILAGGEGTRLRPLTSNQPKPMMPIANLPMMEHIVRLLAEHGFDDIVVTVAFLANHIRNYFGDGSDFGVRMRYATEDSPLGTAGSVRNATDELDETFLVISGDVLTDIDLTALVEGAPRRAARSASIALKRVENPVEFGIVITRRRRHDRAVPREAHVGRGVLRHDQHRHLRARARSSSSSPRARSSTSPATCSRRVLEQGSTLLGTSSTGYWEDVGTLEAYRTRARGHPRRPGAARDRRASELARRRVARRGRRRLARRRASTARCSSATTAAIEAGAVLRAVHRARRRRRREGRRAPRARGRARPRATSGRRRGLRGAVIGRASDIRDARRVEEGVVRRRRVLRRRATRSSTRREDLPVQDGRGRRARHVVDRVGEPGRAHAVRPARRARPRQRRHHVRGRGAARDGVRHRR